MSNDVLISAQGLTRRYGGQTAVADVNLELRKGEILGLLGPNGAGKTTTLRMLAGCLAPSSGQVRIQGVNMAEAPGRAKAGLGYLPESPPLYGELTVDEYLAFCARLHRVARGQRSRAIESAKSDCGIHDVGKRVIGNLSKGYQQRVGIAQAIVHRPDVVILDEPTVGLDPNQIREIRGLITRLGQQHSVLLSSHILPEIQATCSRVTIIHQGRLVFDRPMAEIDTGAQAGLITLGLKTPPARQRLEQIDGVRSAEPGEDGLWRIQAETGADIRELLAREAAEGGWGLFELSARRKTLEEIFAELTSTDAPQKEAA